MKIPLVDLRAQYMRIAAEIDEAMKQVILESAFIKGKYVERFEKEFAEYCGAAFCIGVGNGTDALFIALKGLGIGPGDEVLVPANSFIATSEAVTSVGAHVVFVDVDAVTYNIDVNRIEEKITSRTKAVIPVHLYGQPADMAEINALADRYDLKVIEDAAQAHGARYQGKRVGCLGNVACFSFYPGKNLGAYGDAGAIVTGDADLAGKCRMLANHGRLEKYSHKMEGHNSRLDGLQAAILSVKLKQLDRWSVERNRVADVYRRELGLDRLTLPEIRPDRDHVFHIFGVLAEKRDGLRDYLKEKGIATGIHYPTPLPLLEAYRYLGHQSGTFPVSERLSESMVSLPIYPELTEAQQAHVTGAVKEFYRV